MSQRSRLMLDRRRAVERMRAVGDWCAEAVGTTRDDLAGAHGKGVIAAADVARWAAEMRLGASRILILTDQSRVYIFLMDDGAACLFRLVYGDATINWTYRGEKPTDK